MIFVGCSADKGAKWKLSRSSHKVSKRQKGRNQECTGRKSKCNIMCPAAGFWLAIKGESFSLMLLEYKKKCPAM